MGTEAPEFIAKGSNGQVEAYLDRVVIRRKGIFGYVAQGVRGDRTIYYSEITGVEYKKPTMLAHGYIQFIVTLELASANKTTRLGTTAPGTTGPEHGYASGVQEAKR